MPLKTKPQNAFTPYILEVYDDSLPAGSPRVVARADTRDGKVWRTAKSEGQPRVPLSEIRRVVAEARS